MERIDSYQQYTDLVNAFKEGKNRCTTNKLMMRDEITALIEANKLKYAIIDGVLWFFVDEGYFYAAHFHVPAGTAIHLEPQDMDVVVELTGKQGRYNEQWEQELIATGCEKGDRRWEWSAPMDEIIDQTKEQLAAREALLKQKRMFFRKATRDDYPELEALWEARLGRHRYVLTAMTDVEWDEIERSGRCDVICDLSGRIIATYVYARQGKTASAYHVVALQEKMGLGSAILFRLILSAYQEGCTKFACWIREDNMGSIKMHQRVLKQSDKYYWQFVCKAKA